MRVHHLFKTFVRDARGTSAVEYGIILSFIVIGLVGAVAGLGAETRKMWSFVETQAARAHTYAN